ncbi:adenylate cyclase [Salmonella enterica subsp. enterica serovar Typhi]|nr:adenylate cyclase [Salmonella enterica]ECN7344602.1 adenylate cyclase [Salmonella enterica subsp. enterica serovar Typhi]EDE6522309.1 adenylate cyclase [Salmonella enterica subsp. enterica serovar Typhi]
MFEERLSAKKWEIYEKRKAEMIETCVFLTPKDYEIACRELAELLGI